MINRYANRQILLHWISAIIIIWATMSGFYIAWFDVTPETESFVTLVNPAFGTILIPIFLIRTYYRIKLGAPDYQGDDAALKSKAAHYLHILLYITILIVLITGVLMMERDINMFNLFSIPQPIHNKAVTQFFFEFHVYACMFLGILVVLHIAAAFMHILMGRKIMHRMWFYRKPEEQK